MDPPGDALSVTLGALTDTSVALLRATQDLIAGTDAVLDSLLRFLDMEDVVDSLPDDAVLTSAISGQLAPVVDVLGRAPRIA